MITKQKAIKAHAYYHNSNPVLVMDYQGFEMAIYEKYGKYYAMNNYGEPMLEEPTLWNSVKKALAVGKNDLDLLTQK
jgi:hypothetical protein